MTCHRVHRVLQYHLWGRKESNMLILTWGMCLTATILRPQRLATLAVTLRFMLRDPLFRHQVLRQKCRRSLALTPDRLQQRDWAGRLPQPTRTPNGPAARCTHRRVARGPILRLHRPIVVIPRSLETNMVSEFRCTRMRVMFKHHPLALTLTRALNGQVAVTTAHVVAGIHLCLLVVMVCTDMACRTTTNSRRPGTKSIPMSL